MRFDAGPNAKDLKINCGQSKLALSLRNDRDEMKKEQQQKQISANSSDRPAVWILVLVRK